MKAISFGKETLVLTLLGLFLLVANFTVTAQECAIVNTAITVVDESSFPSFDVAVTGVVQPISCDSVRVELCCESDGNQCAQQVVGVDQNTGNWMANFDDFTCRCHGSISLFEAVAECKEDSLCKTDSATLRYPCPSNDTCPEIDTVLVSVGPCIIDNATSCGYRVVTFTPSISGIPTAYSWNFGDGSNAVDGTGLPGPQDHSYFRPPSSEPRLTLFTTDCEPLIIHYDITETDFQICDSCPLESQVQITTNIDNCEVDGTVVANYCEEQYTSVLINYGDGTNVSVNPSDLNGFTIDHSYNINGDYNLEIILLKDGGNCSYEQELAITNCNEDEGGEDNEGSDDECFFCFCSNLFCCILYILLILAFIGTIVSLAVALCNGNILAWILSGLFLLGTIALFIWLATHCDVPICQLIIALGVGGIANWGIVCGTNILPAQCTSWFCQMTTIPILGIQMQNFLIINILLWLLALILCVF